MRVLATVDTWDQAFDIADQLLIDDKLVTIAVRSKKEVDQKKPYVSTYLGELTDPETSLKMARRVYANLFDGKTPIELWHHQMNIAHPNFIGKAWALTFIIPD